MICAGSLRGVFIAEVETGEELELAPTNLESVGRVLDGAVVPRDVVLLMASACELSAAVLPTIGVMDADGFCSLPIGLWGLAITLDC